MAQRAFITSVDNVCTPWRK